MNLLKVLVLSFFLIFFYASQLSASSIAVFPYKVENASVEFGTEQGDEFAKLTGIAIYVKNRFNIYNPLQLEKDLKQLGINPIYELSLEDLALFCKMRYVDYVVTGKIVKTSKLYKVESILFSAKTKSIISKTNNTAETLYALTEKDNKSLMIAFPAGLSVDKKNGIDIACLIDASYNMNDDIAFVKDSLKEFSRNIYENWDSSRIFIVTYNDKKKYPDIAGPLNNYLSFSKNIDDIKINGTNSEMSFQKAVKWAASDLSWKKDNEKIVFIISNSDFTDKDYTSQYSLSLSRKKVPVYSILLGMVSNESAVSYKKLSTITGGKSISVVYKQSLFDKTGSLNILYYQSGRLCVGGSENNLWKNGLFISDTGAALNPQYGNELLIKEVQTVSPYRLYDFYLKVSEKPIIDKKNLENNISDIFQRMPDNISGKKQLMQGKIAGKALLSDDKITFWADITNDTDYAFFEKTKSTGTYYTLGVRIKKKKDSPYGISFNPSFYITDVSEYHIPKMCSTDLTTLLQKSDYHYNNGLFSPPYWFLKVKTVEIVRYKTGKDIRD